MGQRIASKIEFYEKNAEMEAAAHSEGQPDIDKYLTIREPGYNMDFCQLIQAEIVEIEAMPTPNCSR